jgi:membrane protein insertase Oxa1/YidC/SpoIIIJ
MAKLSSSLQSSPIKKGKKEMNHHTFVGGVFSDASLLAFYWISVALSLAAVGAQYLKGRESPTPKQYSWMDFMIAFIPAINTIYGFGFWTVVCIDRMFRREFKKGEPK